MVTEWESLTAREAWWQKAGVGSRETTPPTGNTKQGSQTSLGGKAAFRPDPPTVTYFLPARKSLQ